MYIYSSQPVRDKLQMKLSNPVLEEVVNERIDLIQKHAWRKAIRFDRLGELVSLAKLPRLKRVRKKCNGHTLELHRHGRRRCGLFHRYLCL